MNIEPFEENLKGEKITFEGGAVMTLTEDIEKMLQN